LNRLRKPHAIRPAECLKLGSVDRPPNEGCMSLSPQGLRARGAQANHRGPGPNKRGHRGRSRTVGRIKRGGGNGGEPVRSPLGRIFYTPAARHGDPRLSRDANGHAGSEND
jgi:hypothetical protein